MQVQLTSEAILKLQASPVPIKLTGYKLGSDFSFTPSLTDTDVHGSTQWSGTPSEPQVMNANTVKYSIYLDYNLGDFSFGNVGLFTPDGKLFALGAATTAQAKVKVQGTGTTGNSIRLDFYLSSAGNDYSMFLDYAETSHFHFPTLDSVDQLPPSSSAIPNAYVISGASSAQETFLAYTARNGLWGFDAYKFSNTVEFTVTATTPRSVKLTTTDTITYSYFGQYIVQFITGPNFGVCRYIDSIVKQGNDYTFNFLTPMMQLPNVGDKAHLYMREPLSVSNVILPIATTNQLGVIKVGDGLSVQADGTLSANLRTINSNLPDASGNIDITVDLTEYVKSVMGEGPDNMGNVELPIAASNSLGVVMQEPVGPGGAQPNIIIDSTGKVKLSFNPVTSVNSMTGAVTLNGLVTIKELEDNTDMDTVLDPGLYYSLNARTLINGPANAIPVDRVLVVVAPLGTGGTYQEWMPEGFGAFTRFEVPGAWVAASAVLPIATTSTLGVVQIGSRLEIDTNGILSVPLAGPRQDPANPSVPVHVAGAVKQGSGITIDASGSVIANLRTISGQLPDPSGDINLEQLVGNEFVRWADVGVMGGVAKLDRPDDTVPETQEGENTYVYARITGSQLPLGTLLTVGTVNAASLELTYYSADTFITGNVDSLDITLTNGGTIAATVVMSSEDDPGVQDTYNLTNLKAQGYVVRAGADLTGLSLDNITSLKEGDVIYSDGTEWRALGGGGEGSVDWGTASAFETGQATPSVGTNKNSLSLGADSTTSKDNQVSIGTLDATGVATKTRTLSGVSDPEEDHDAANKKFVSRVLPETYTSNVTPRTLTDKDSGLLIYALNSASPSLPIKINIDSSSVTKGFRVDIIGPAVVTATAPGEILSVNELTRVSALSPATLVCVDTNKFVLMGGLE